MKPIWHFYHVYADGQWKTPLTEHLDALTRSGLYAELDKFYVGIVGSYHNIVGVKSMLSRSKAEVFTTSPTGWEQETMRYMPELLLDRDVNVFYAHTKGASDPSQINFGWRRSMTYYNVVKWRSAVEILNNYDAYGCHICTGPDGTQNYYAGTYWWATNTYLQTLEPIFEHHRYGAEGWIATNPDGNKYDANPGWPSQDLFTTEWTFNEDPH